MKKIITSIECGAALFRELVFQAGCPLCGTPLMSLSTARQGLCDSCAEKFRVDTSPRCSVCGKPLISEHGVCVSCRKKNDFAFDSAVGVFPYMGRYKELLKSYKFGGRQELSFFLAEKYLQAVELLPDCLPFDAKDALWVPVPPRAGKIKYSGWDQIEKIARVLEGKAPLQRVLKRLSSKTQKELGKEEREHNLKGKIIALKPVSGNIILFDDVFTTGSTLSVCAEVLKKSGAQKVFGLCMFYG